ncbi:hypothetical protein [Petrimonas mucosa]|jgi:hypothetical protein|uniref:Lipoprotein n=1 Tax=Petrimonas mucosa TaxID=1642646 RepID=A0A1G4G7F0_9BACT|nr:hypothetical protein [Petrimonas mucosa]MDD3561372.1 hypothetical protein [Petrimonas mucosa]SCM58080.1 putative protein {ECO:0000313/EMBL:KKQ32938,1} [Petrimonas mucosa]SFU69932.1 hypothetical protein SAMN05216364_10746 [Porphyromonadaceae bacterium KHP3R9]HHT30223.1 hypothetical protein [Petrimonas mucosa]
MNRKLIISLFGVMFLSTYGCDGDVTTNGKVELYLIQSYTTVDNSYQIVESSVVTAEIPLIEYDDILSYDSKECIFELSDRAINSIKALETSVYGLAFAIKANDTLVYTGYFWPSYSSVSCDWVVVDPNMTGIGNTMQVSLGYPGLIQGKIIQDKRNDKRIVQILREDRKLK